MNKTLKATLMIIIFLATIASATAWSNATMYNNTFAYYNITEGAGAQVSERHQNTTYLLTATGGTGWDINHFNATGEAIYSDSTNGYWNTSDVNWQSAGFVGMCSWTNFSDADADYIGC